ncbi:MAG: protein translocase subunit SecF [Acidobacteriaceae bacterium]
MELFHDVNIDWLGKKWYFLSFSLVFSIAGILSMAFWHHIPLSVDFRGGTDVTIKFAQPVSADHIRSAMDAAGIKDPRIQAIGRASENEVLIGLDLRETSESQLESGKTQIVNALNKAGFKNFEVTDAAVVGAVVGKQLQKQAFLATLYSLIGMLVYLWFRFELIYGVAAVVAVFHDTLITVGAFSLTNTEISLTVIAAILTLIGYSMNDTIVVFDRIRENLKLRRRESLAEIVNTSINQTLSRTVLTSGLTLLTVLALFFFGGEVLHGFSFALVIGIIIGTYSSIAVAAPMLVAYQEHRMKKGKPVTLPTGKKARA